MRNCENCGKPLLPLQKRYCSRKCCGACAKFNPPESALLLQDVKRVTEELNRAPTWMEYLRLGNYHPATIWHRFGHWHKVLDLIGIPPIPLTSWSLDLITPEDGGWLAGFFAGEGHFDLLPILYKGLTRYDPHISVSQRADNPQPIQEVIRLWQLEPSVYQVVERSYKDDPNCYPGKPLLNLAIRDTPTIYSRVVPTFKQFPMRTKKQVDFEYLAQAIEIFIRRRKEYRFNREYTIDERAQLTELHKAIRNNRQYRDTELPFSVRTYVTKGKVRRKH